MQNKIPFLDRMLTAEEAAAWLGIPVRSLMDKHRAGIVPGFNLGSSKRGGTIRFLPRAVMVNLAKRSGQKAFIDAAAQRNIGHLTFAS